MQKSTDSHFGLQNSTNPQNKHFAVHETCTEMCGVVDVWITEGFETIFLDPRVLNGEYFAKNTEKIQILDDFLEKAAETLNDLGCPKI